MMKNLFKLIMAQIKSYQVLLLNMQKSHSFSWQREIVRNLLVINFLLKKNKFIQ